MISTSTQEIVWQRLTNQRLMRSTCATPADVVTWLGAVQAQDYPGAKWGVGQRMKSATDEALDRAFDEGAILRTHVMRPTWHFVPPADIKWMQALTAPRVNTVSGSYYRSYELDDRVFARTRTVLERVLRDHSYLTRTEIAKAFHEARIPCSGLRLGLIVMRAELDAVICSGPRRGKQFTYALVDERAPRAKTLPRDAALAELTTRYFSSHGPATIRDYVWWSGLTVREAKEGVAMVKASLDERSLGELTYFSRPAKGARAPGGPVAHLVPAYDESLIAYKDRGTALDREKSQKPPSTMDQYGAFLTIDGRLRGTWRRTIRTNTIEVKVTTFAKLTAGQRDAVESAAEDYSRFMQRPIALTIGR